MGCLLSLLLIFNTTVSLAASGTEGHGVLPRAQPEWQTLVLSPHASYEWSIDPNTDRLNFRRCDWDDMGHIGCAPPVLSRGLSRSDLHLLMQFYLETIQNSGGHKINQIVGILTASLVGIGAYVGIAVTVMNLIPASISTILKSGYHVITVGGILGLLGYAWTIEQARSRQSTVYRSFRNAAAKDNLRPPAIFLPSQAVFEEFDKTFHRSLWEFTHPQNYNPEINLILQ